MQRDAPPGEKIILNVYDLHWTNEYTSALGLGVFHSGIEVYGIEFGYGGHPFPLTGVFEMAPRDHSELGEHFSFREAIVLGTTTLSEDDVRDIVESLSPRFLGDQYHLLRYNCNHFSNEFAQILCGAAIPGWINRLASMATTLPFVERALPKEWLTPCGLQTMASVNVGTAETSRQNNNINNELLDSFVRKTNLSTPSAAPSSNSKSPNNNASSSTVSGNSSSNSSSSMAKSNSSVSNGRVDTNRTITLG